jgi:hypothetical protein
MAESIETAGTISVGTSELGVDTIAVILARPSIELGR